MSPTAEGLRWAVLAAAWAAAWGCGVRPCTADGECPPLTYCAGVGATGSGQCAQDCTLNLQCGSGQVCSRQGRCTAEAGAIQIVIEQPAEGSALTAGTTVDVSGTVTLGTGLAVVSLGGVDGVGCSPVPPMSVEVLASPRREPQPFVFSGVPVGEGGGYFSVSVLAHSADVLPQRITYSSGVLCSDCPPVRLEAPAPDSRLPALAMGAVVTGTVTGATRAPLLFRSAENGTVLEVPLPVGASAFSRVVPLLPGMSTVGVRVESAGGGTRACRRYAVADPGAAPLSAHLSWEGRTADLDLVVVPPQGRVSQGACRGGAVQAWCVAPPGDQRAPGPEVVQVTQLEDGAWGVGVQTIPGAEGPVRAVVSVVAAGTVLLQLGPTQLDPRVAQAWLAAVVYVDDGAITVGVHDVTVDELPSGTPATW